MNRMTKHFSDDYEMGAKIKSHRADPFLGEILVDMKLSNTLDPNLS